MRFQSYFNTAVQLINAYNGSMPLAHYLKNYFAQYKKHGSKDRKYISHLCYCHYRLGHALAALPVEERLKAALFLCNDSIAEWAVLFDEKWLSQDNISLNERVEFLHREYRFTVQQIFPWAEKLSAGIDAEGFAKSHLIQPDLFLRIRPGKKDAVIAKLQTSNMAFEEMGETCLAFSNSSQVDKIIALNTDAVVQDYSSQQIGAFFRSIQLETGNWKPGTKIWDCCAASGGKSILAYDTFENAELTVSDIRPSIIANLKERFAEAGIKKYKSFVADLSNSRFTIPDSRFDLVICDVPCSGSGTWGRTPEQLYFFTAGKISHYATLQQKILGNVLPHVQKSRYFLYITCSVFSIENESAVRLLEQKGFSLVKKAVLKGYAKKADTMFAALFVKS